MKTMRQMHRCISCGAPLSAPLFIMDDTPKGAFYFQDEAGLNEDKGVTLPLCYCEHCGLFQLDIKPVDYYKDALRVAALSKTMQKLRRDDFGYLLDHYDLKEKKWIEIGCGNGDFLKILKDFPVEIYGTENDYENVKITRLKLGLDSSHIFKFFPDDKDLKIPGAPFDCFLSFNFLEHQPYPVSMLKCIWNNLAEGGYGLITVPSFEYILDNGAYYELLRDHIANYTKTSIRNLLLRSGFKVLETKFTGSGDTLRVIVKKVRSDIASAGLKSDSPDLVTKCLALKENYIAIKNEIGKFCTELKSKGSTLALWGAGHQGMTIAATTLLKEQALYIVDSSPKKQGLYAPVSHLKIVPPGELFKDPVDVIMITAPGYVSEIEENIRKMYESARKHSGAAHRPALPQICDIKNLSPR